MRIDNASKNLVPPARSVQYLLRGDIVDQVIIVGQ